MNCLKCGRKTENVNVFCSECLQVMDAYPVKQDAPVQIPQRPVRSPEKQVPHRKELSPVDSTRQFRKLIKWLVGVIAVLSVLLCITAGLLLQVLNEKQPVSNIGRNYTTDTSTQP